MVDNKLNQSLVKWRIYYENEKNKNFDKLLHQYIDVENSKKQKYLNVFIKFIMKVILQMSL